MHKPFIACALAAAAIAFSHPADARSSHRKLHHHHQHYRVSAQAEVQSYSTNGANTGANVGTTYGATSGRTALDAAIARHAAANGLPAELVHRVVLRESRYNPRAANRSGALGLMQIKHATARGMGYSGSASGLLDAETNLTYAVRYLAGAYKVAGGNANRAVALYQSGYYYAAKRQGMIARRDIAPSDANSSYAANSSSAASSFGEPTTDMTASNPRGMRSSRVAMRAGAQTSEVSGAITRRQDDM